MTDDLGYGITNYFAMELLDSRETLDGNCVEKYSDGHDFTVVYRLERYRRPESTFSFGQEADADQIFESALNGNIDCLLEDETE